MDSLFCHQTYPKKKIFKKMSSQSQKEQKLSVTYYQLSYTHVFETFVMITNNISFEIKNIGLPSPPPNKLGFLLFTYWKKLKRHFINKYPQNILPISSSSLQCLKITQNIAFEFSNFGIFHQFWPIRTGLSGNTVWPQASGFQKLAKLDHFWHFLINFCPLKM